jgi:hypothetical protein
MAMAHEWWKEMKDVADGLAIATMCGMERADSKHLVDRSQVPFTPFRAQQLFPLGCNVGSRRPRRAH